jgi:hypothetical protein
MTRMRAITPPTVEPGRYRHFKGKLYEVIGVVRHSETLEEMVLYRALYKNRASALWVRPLPMFVEKVDVGGKSVPRFERLPGKSRP